MARVRADPRGREAIKGEGRLRLLVIATAVIALTGSGVAPTNQPAADATPEFSQAERCPYARLGLAFYRGRFIHWQLQRDASIPSWRKPRSCPDARYLANLWASRSFASR